MRITRTYPTPDSPAPHIGPRERALAVFKYLLDLEPEAAVKHPLFACIVHAFEQAELRGAILSEGWGEQQEAELAHPDTGLRPSLVSELSSTREAVLPQTAVPDEGPL